MLPRIIQELEILRVFWDSEGSLEHEPVMICHDMFQNAKISKIPKS